MRKISYFYSASLDGYIEDRDGSLAWTEPDEELHKFFNKMEDRVDTHLYGRRMWELMSAFWPTGDEDPDSSPAMVEYAGIWRSKAKVVFSKTLESVEGATLLHDFRPDEIREWKAQPGGDMSLGGATLAAAFIEHDLVDEFHIALYPLLLGGGKPMFRPMDHGLELRLAECRRFDRGVVFLRYERVRV